MCTKMKRNFVHPMHAISMFSTRPAALAHALGPRDLKELVPKIEPQALTGLDSHDLFACNPRPTLFPSSVPP